MKVACHQPVYFARLHLAQRWLNVDRLVWLKNVQFARKSADEHGVSHPTGQSSTDVAEKGRTTTRLTVPVGASRLLLSYTPVGTGWQEQHLRTLKANYVRMGWWEQYEASLTAVIEGEYGSLADLNVATWRWIVATLQTQGPEILTDDGIVCYSSERIVECCERAEAKTYVAGRPSIMAYLDRSEFEARSIELEAQDWPMPEYRQPSEKFQPNLSVLDLVLSVGGENARQILIGERQ